MSEDAVYGASAQDYWAAGWRGVLPLPPKKKKWPPTGYSGHEAQEPSFPDVMSWIETRATGNLALHLPHGIIGLDVDAYGAKTGEATFNEAIRRWGALPSTVRSTSRTDNVSGIRMYRIPADVELKSEIKFPELNFANIEVVQFSHRYVVSYPSIHPDTGLRYEWLDEDCQIVGIPSIDSLPDLPARWLEGLRTESFTITERANPFATLKGYAEGPMDAEVKEALREAQRQLDTEPGSRHDAAMKAVLRLIRLGEKRHTGIIEALTQYGKDFAHATRDRNTPEEARGEYSRMVLGQRGHDLIASTPSGPTLEQLRDNTYGIVAGPVTRQITPEITESEDRLVGLSRSEALELLESPAEVASPLAGAQGYSEEDDFLFSADDRTEPARPAVEYQAPQDDSGKSMRERLLSVSDLASIKPTEPLVDRLLYRNTLVQIAGNPGSYKTFFTLALACAVASPHTRSWEGHQVISHGPVIYVVAEGVSGVRARILAWCESENVDPDSLELYLYPEAIQLGSYDQIEELKELSVAMNAKLVVFDTRARCTSDMDENDAKEQGTAIERAEGIRQASGATVVMVHHSSRSGTAGRGSNSWDGAVWSDLRVSTEGMVMTVHCEKHKDATSGCDHEFVAKPVTVSAELMPDTDEDIRSTIILGAKETMPGTGNEEAKEIVLKILRDQALANGFTPNHIIAESGLESRTVYRAMKVLEERNHIRNVGTVNTRRYVATVEKPETGV